MRFGCISVLRVGQFSRELCSVICGARVLGHNQHRSSLNVCYDQEMETETRIALASAKAMARRMLGDEKGCREYEVRIR